MKQKGKLLWCALVVGLLGACAPESEKEISTVEKMLTEEEVQYFENYLNQSDNYGFLLSVYEKPSEVDLEQVFYVGAGMQITEMSEEECRAYLKAAGMEEIYTDVTHLTRTQIENFLQEKLGLGLQDMETPFSWVYVPEYDSYYHQAGDTNMISWDCVSGSVSEEIYRLKVDCPEYSWYDCDVTLRKVGDGYQFVSNKLRESVTVPENGLYTGLSWQQSYISLIQEGASEWQGCQFLYLNDDDIPELVVIGEDMDADCRIYHYYDGTLYETQLRRSYFTYIERKNLLCNSGGNTYSYYDIIYQMTDEEMTILAVGRYGVGDSETIEADENGDLVYQYTWNDSEVSEEEYWEKLNAVYDTSKAKDGYEWGEWYTADEMVQLLSE